MGRGYHEGSIRAPPNRSRVTKLFTDVAAVPEPRGEIVGLWTRRAVMTIFAVVAVLGLLDVFGQGTTHTVASTPAAVLSLTAPEAVRGGLFCKSRVKSRARRAIAHPRLVLDVGWIEGMQVNSIEPSPVGEASRDGRLVLSYDALKPGDLLRIWFQFEVNPTNVGHRSYAIELDDAERAIARLAPDITVLP